MIRAEDAPMLDPATDPRSVLAGIRTDKDELPPPVSPFTERAHRVANEGTDERGLRQQHAEEMEKERTRGA